ncbi:MAG TPA: hypothetical protein VIK14_12000 [Ignavibacteria bacterium]
MESTILDNKLKRDCKAVKGNGETCGAKAMKESEFCYFHNPAVSEQRKESKRNGGKHKVIVINGSDMYKPVKLETPKQVTRFYNKLVNEILSGEMDMRIATGIGYLLNGLLKSLEMSELTERLENIETMIETINNNKNTQI